MSRERPGFFRSLFDHAAYLLNFIAAIWLVMCAAAPHISPLQVKYLALFSLTSPFALVTNLLFVIFWLFQRCWRRTFISILALGIGYQLILSVFTWNYFGKNDMQPGDNRIKVMTWNVHGLGLFDKPHDATKDDKIMDFIQQENPDILCLPEFYTIYSNALKPYSTTLLKKCGYREFRFKDDNSLGVKIYLGTAIFSKYPIRDFKDIPLAKHVYLLQCDMVLPNKSIVRACFIHLQSYMLSDIEKTDIEAVKHRDKEIDVNQSKSYIRRFGEIYKRRAVQADSAAGIISHSPYPVIICGDFNDLPGSYTYETMKRNLADAFAEKGHGLGRTFNMFSPTLRIDYIFYDPAFMKILGCRIQKTVLSDHNPVIANFELKPAP